MESSRQVAKDRADSQAKELGLGYFEVSAKENIGVEHLFRSVAKSLPASSSERKKVILDSKKEEP